MCGSSNDFSKKIENCQKYGGLSEWFMELVLKTSDGVKPTVSSNLTASAKTCKKFVFLQVFSLYKENHQPGWWFQKALAMSRKNILL